MKITRDVNMSCNFFNKPNYPVGIMTKSGLEVIQPEEIEKYCTAFHVRYDPSEDEKIEYCTSDKFEKCQRYMKRKGRPAVRCFDAE